MPLLVVEAQLVLVNVSDHFTRVKYGGGNGEKRVIGILFGCQAGQSIHVYDSFEMEFEQDEATGAVVLDEEFIRKKEEHFTAVYPTYELLGWYSVGTQVGDTDMAVHRSVSSFNESPLFLLVDSNIQSGSKELPVKMYESVMQVVEEVPTMIFVDVDFQVETIEPERITIDHIVKGGGQDVSSLTQHLGDLRNSISMLNTRMRLLENYLRMVKEGAVTKDHGLLREISAICNKLPMANSAAFARSFNAELEDAITVSLLATVTKSAAAVNEVQGKFALSNSR